MSRQNIQFKGLRHAPSDITGQDGDLLECVNLVHQNGELKPLEMPEKTQMKGVYDNETLVAVHNLTDGKKFVFAVWNGVVTTIHVKDENNPSSPMFTRGIPNEKIQWAETIGNTLIIGTDKSTHYALYKNGQYKWLGDKLPQPVFEFDMGKNWEYVQDSENESKLFNSYEPNAYGMDADGNVNDGGGILLSVVYDTVDGLSGQNGDRWTELVNTTTENKKIIRDNLRSKMATLVSNSKKNGRFIYPFMVRYAIRMYDNTYTMHSAPILMLPSTAQCPILAYLGFIDYQDNSDITAWFNLALQIKAKSLRLKFKGFYNEGGDNITSMVSDWSDIIKGVDLFLSSQVVTYNDSYFDDLENMPVQYFNRVDAQGDNTLPDFGYEYSQNAKTSWATNHAANNPTLFTSTFLSGVAVYSYKNQYFPLPSYTSEYLKEKLAATNLFYKVKNYDLDGLLATGFIDTLKYLHNEIEYGTLERLETLPILPDDYVSRSRIVGNASYNYNQRLILGNINLQAPLWYQDTKTFNTQNYNIQIWFEIEKPEKTIRVYWNKNNVGLKDFGHYLYYPDPDCKRAVIDTDTYHVVVPMSEHTGLHGAYALMPELESLWEAASNDDLTPYTGMLPTASTPEQRYYSMQNTIAMSGVANPFHFPATNFKDIGRAKVIGIAANMLDVSSAQWGQYPIYVFCSDGIIAVMIDGEGKMGGIQAVSADVLREPQGLSQPTLVQTGQTLMFLTQRGVIAIAGTKIACVSEAMEGRHFNPMRDLADVDYHVGAFQNLITRTSDNTSFVDFAANGFLAYDYAHNRVMLLRSDKDYQYLFDMKTGLWSKQIVYTNLSTLQMVDVPGTNPPADRGGDTSPTRELKVKPIRGAVNNYTEMYLQDADGYLYRTMEVMNENATKQLYQYGYFISRPVRFGTDEYKTITRALHRYTHYANNSFVRWAVYGSRDGMKYGRINTLRGMSYQYFIFAIYTYMKPNERYSYLSVDFETRLSNKLR